MLEVSQKILFCSINNLAQNRQLIYFSKISDFCATLIKGDESCVEIYEHVFNVRLPKNN